MLFWRTALFCVVAIGAGLAFNTRAAALDGKGNESTRIVQDIDRDWTFQYFPQQVPSEHWAEREADDSRWPAVALPHTWSVYETTRERHPFIEHATEREDSYWWYGWGWYRKHLTIAKPLSDREVFLEFDGVQKVASVYVNGHLAGRHKGGYTSFCFDVTRWIRFGEDNVIAVRVSNRRDDEMGRIPPMTAGNFNVYGGIYRTVRLVLTNKVHVPFQGSADSEGGSLIRTPKVTDEAAAVEDTTWVRNDGALPAEMELQSQILDGDGKVVATQTTRAVLSAGEIKSIPQSFASLPHPHLWSPSTPYLYGMVSTILLHGAVADHYESTFGVRTFYWNRAEERLYLNGKPIQLIGTNRHQDFPWLGDAMPVWLQLADLRDMRYNLGYNFQRTAHYPQDPAVYDFCDRNGMIVLEESPNIKDIDFGRDVQQQTMREMVRRDRNHPSILFWGIGNETDHPADSTWAWEEDKTRLINLRRGTNGGDHVMTTDNDLALEQTLRCTVRGWYNDDAHDFSPEDREPVSGQITGTEEWQHESDAQYLKKKLGKNIVVFLYADHGADRIYRDAPLKYVNPKGWVDGLRFPKYVYFLWQANFTEKPMVFIHPWPWQQRYLGRKETIIVDSNADTVELQLDGKSQGVRRPSNENAHVVQFENIEVTNGTLRAVARKGEATVEEVLPMPAAPARLELRVREAHLTADRSGLAVLEVDAVDAKGNHVPYIHPDIDWKMSGEGRLVGPSVYKTDTDQNGAGKGTMYIDLPTANLVRTTDVPGEIQVTVSSPGLEPATITLRSTPASVPVSGIIEPALSDAGRHSAVRDAAFAANVGNAPPRVFEHIEQDYKLPADSPENARASMERFLHEHNPKLSTDNRAYQDSVSKLVRLLEENHGNLIADWYNFTADQYEDVALLAATIERSGIPSVFKASLESDYADRILLRGELIDVSQESKLLAAELNGAQVVSTAATPTAGEKHTSASTVGELAASSYPLWRQMKPEQRTRALETLYRFNPVLRTERGSPSADQRLPSGPILLVAESALLD